MFTYVGWVNKVMPKLHPLIVILAVAGWVFFIGYGLSKDSCVENKLCPTPYETLLTANGVICRMPPVTQTEYYIQSADGLITYNCTEKPQVYVRQIFEIENRGAR
jgi:hypothetical protein